MLTKEMGEEKYLQDVFRLQHLYYLYFTKNEETKTIILVRTGTHADLF